MGGAQYFILTSAQIQSRPCPLQQVFMFLYEVECSDVTHIMSEVAAGRHTSFQIKVTYIIIIYGN
jgi:hypothetical protein